MPETARVRDYDTLYREFRWAIPPRYNIGVDVCDRWAAHDPGRLAILHVRGDGGSDRISYGWLRETSNRLANVLRAHGVTRGDRVVEAADDIDVCGHMRLPLAVKRRQRSIMPSLPLS